MGYKVIFSNKPDIIVCGSILGKKKIINKNTKIWGVGLHFNEELINMKNPDFFYAVRGKLTLNKIKITSDIVLGDPGLLLSRFYRPLTKTKYDICIVSHYIDYNYFNENFGDKYFIINMGTNNIEQIANSINKCNFIFSSSLHGIIFSHSLGIPAVHLEYKLLNSKNNFKFKDYYSILDIPYIKEDLKKDNLNNIIKKIKDSRIKYLPSRTIVKQIQDNLLFCFPYQKMTNIIYTIYKKDIKYINSWSEYHLNLGFDNIYIFAYESNSNNYIGDLFHDKYKSRIHLLNINDRILQKNNLYNNFFNKFKFNYKWCAHIDINEYIILEKWNHLYQFLNLAFFKNVSIISLKIFQYSYNKDKTNKYPIEDKMKIITKRFQSKLLYKLDNYRFINRKNILKSNIFSKSHIFYNRKTLDFSNNKSIYIIKFLNK